MAQDDMGFLWFGTDQGLARFDGTRFKVFGVKDGLPDPEVLNIFKDSQGRLWLSCFQQKPCYFQNGKFFTEENDENIARLEMKTGTYYFYEDGKSRLWIVGDKEKYCKVENNVVKCFENPRDVETGSMRNFIRVGEINGELFFVTAARPHIYILKNEEIEFVWGVMAAEAVSKTYAGHFFINQSIVSVQSDSLVKLAYVDNDFKRIESIQSKGGKNYFLDKDGFAWLSNFKTGVQKMVVDKRGFALEEVFFADKKVNRVFQNETKGVKWFLIEGGGIYGLFKNPSFLYSENSFPVFNSNQITVITDGINGELLLGDNKGNVYSYIKGIWTQDSITGHSDKGAINVISVSPCLKRGWVAIGEAIIGSRQKKEIEIRNRGTSSIKAGYKKVLCRNGEVWLGTSGYLVNWKEGSNDIEFHLNDYRVTSLEKDSEGNVWVSGSGGVLSEQDGFEKKWDEIFPVLSNRIVDMKSGKANDFWIATSTKGLLKAKTDRGKMVEVTPIDDSTNVALKNITSLFIDEQGSPWVSTVNGLYHVQNDWVVNYYDQSDGLVSNDINGVVVREDTIWVATNDGLSCLSLKPNKKNVSPPVYLTSLNYEIGKEKKEIDLVEDNCEKEKLYLPVEASNIQIKMASLDFQYAKRLKYEYKVSEELMPVQYITWRNFFHSIRNNNDTTIIDDGIFNYGAHMHAGQQLISVTAILKNGEKSKSIDSMVLTKLPHWTNTIWFSLVIGGLLFFIFRKIYLMNTAFRRIESQNNKLQLQAIKSQINPHFIGNSINAIQQFFYPPNPEKASEYISIFTNLIRRSIYFVEKSFISFEDEISFIQEYLTMVQLRFEGRFRFQIKGIDVIEKNTQFPAMILQPILENATIHGLAEEGNSLLEIVFWKSGNVLHCSVTDNGPGIKVSQKRKMMMGVTRKSNGITLLKKKIATLNQMYGIDVKLKFIDLSKEKNGVNGTKVVLSYNSQKLSSESVS